MLLDLSTTMINLAASLISMWLLLLLLLWSAVSSGDVDLITRNANAAAAQAHELDVALQNYALEALLTVKIKTGVAYEGSVPCNLTGVRVSAMRLKSGSLLTRGVKRYQEFEIPKGVVTHPYVERLLLLYHNLANWSITYYPLLHLEGQGHGPYTYLAPIIGLLAYDASNLELEPRNRNTTPLYIHASADPISIHFSHLLLPLPTTSTSATAPPNLKCVFFDLNGSVTLTNMSSDNICTTFVQGHFSVVIESPSPPPPSSSTSTPGTGNSNWEKQKKKIVGGVFGGFALMVMLGMGVVGASQYKRKKKMHSMEMVAEFSEALYITAVGTTKAPKALGTRTLPKLETEYLP